MADAPDNRLTLLMRRLDDLLDEAAHLRDELDAAMRRRLAHPFWPERRRVNVPHHPDRRSS